MVLGCCLLPSQRPPFMSMCREEHPASQALWRPHRMAAHRCSQPLDRTLGWENGSYYIINLLVSF